jgi:hypothetical protein
MRLALLDVSLPLFGAIGSSFSDGPHSVPFTPGVRCLNSSYATSFSKHIADPGPASQGRERKASPAERRPKSQKAAKQAKPAAGTREGSKAAKSLGWRRRPDGATLKELMKSTGSRIPCVGSSPVRSPGKDPATPGLEPVMYL